MCNVRCAMCEGVKFGTQGEARSIRMPSSAMCPPAERTYGAQRPQATVDIGKTMVTEDADNILNREGHLLCFAFHQRRSVLDERWGMPHLRCAMSEVPYARVQSLGHRTPPPPPRTSIGP